MKSHFSRSWRADLDTGLSYWLSTCPLVGRSIFQWAPDCLMQLWHMTEFHLDKVQSQDACFGRNPTNPLWLWRIDFEPWQIVGQFNLAYRMDAHPNRKSTRWASSSSVRCFLVPLLAFSATLPDTLSCKVDLGTPCSSAAFRMLILSEATDSCPLHADFTAPSIGGQPLCGEGYVHSYLAMRSWNARVQWAMFGQ